MLGLEASRKPRTISRSSFVGPSGPSRRRYRPRRCRPPARGVLRGSAGSDRGPGRGPDARTCSDLARASRSVGRLSRSGLDDLLSGGSRQPDPPGSAKRVRPVTKTCAQALLECRGASARPSSTNHLRQPLYPPARGHAELFPVAWIAHRQLAGCVSLPIPSGWLFFSVTFSRALMSLVDPSMRSCVDNRKIEVAIGTRRRHCRRDHTSAG
jgi:hypothetical protein